MENILTKLLYSDADVIPARLAQVPANTNILLHSFKYPAHVWIRYWQPLPSTKQRFRHPKYDGQAVTAFQLMIDSGVEQCTGKGLASLACDLRS